MTEHVRRLRLKLEADPGDPSLAADRARCRLPAHARRREGIGTSGTASHQRVTASARASCPGRRSTSEIGTGLTLRCADAEPGATSAEQSAADGGRYQARSGRCGIGERRVDVDDGAVPSLVIDIVPPS